jgi:hypothetical protein
MHKLLKSKAQSSKPKFVLIQRQNEKGGMQKPALAPARSPRRGRIVRRSFENVYDWIGRTLTRKTRNKRKLFPLPGERIK